MNPSNSIILTIAAAILLLRVVFRKSPTKNPKTKGIPPPASVITIAPAASSSAAGKFDVFLSFRGPDTRYGFTDFLYSDLTAAGIYTFRDNEELRIGETLGPEILKAIDDSKISIVIFSKSYAESKWCLFELLQIVKCYSEEGQKILPIFYDVDVSDVRNQMGSYMNAFRKHEKNFNKEIVEDWRNALKTVANLKGYELKTETKGHQGELVKKVVRDVLLELKKNYVHLPNDLVGMDHHIQEMTRLLQVDSDGVRIVGIHGIGGIGKTTIAKVIYNKLCHSFDCCCFLEDVRERAKQYPDGLVGLQKQLLFQIIKRDFPDIVNVEDGIKKIKDVVHKGKVLIVLDDVSEKSQFDKLAGECNWFDNTSRIIITTRNKEVLDAVDATCSRKGLHEAYRNYEPELMSDDDSLRLFCTHAFMRDSPPDDYRSLSQQVRFIAAGLPLVLVTLGSLFLGIRDKSSWIAKLKKLKKVPDKDVMGKLKISFDALDGNNKKLFLDIACLFIGKDKTGPCYMWEDCELVPEDGVNTLILRSLVKLGIDNKFKMHDQLRDLGRQIVQEESMYKLSRVWHPEEALKVLSGDLGLGNVEALNLDFRALEIEEYEQLIHVKQEHEHVRIQGKEYYMHRLKAQNFSRLQNLRYLRLGCVILDKDFNNLSNLRWLEWRCCGVFAPINLNMENLVILNLSNSTITDIWEGWTLFKASTKLKVINMSSCVGFLRGPNFSKFKNIECLNMTGCKSMRLLRNLSNLRMLRKLVLKDCSNLHHIEGLEDLVSLEHLDLSGCESIERLPDLSTLRMLKVLLLNFCQNLLDVGVLGALGSLERLNMIWCKKIVRLPDMSNLRMLKRLVLNSCYKLVEIGSFGGLISLETLSMKFCDSMERLPDLSNMGKLKQLHLLECKKLREIEGLSGLVSLERLNLRGCISLGNTLDFSCLKNLKVLELDGLQHWTEIRGLEELELIEVLYLRQCSLLEKLPCLANLTKLKKIYTDGCVKLHGRY